MFYSVYKNITEREFIDLKEKLNIIERVISPIMQLRGFYQNRDGHYQEYLGLDYIHEDSEFAGNIGVKYDEEKSSTTSRLFSCYILKSNEKNGLLYHRKEHLETHYTMEEIFTDSITLFEKCLITYDSISDNMLVPDTRSIL